MNLIKLNSFMGWMSVLLIIGTILDVTATENNIDQCKEQCKDEPGEPNSVCGRKAVGTNAFKYMPFRNECELKCMGYEERNIKACTPIQTISR